MKWRERESRERDNTFELREERKRANKESKRRRISAAPKFGSVRIGEKGERSVSLFVRRGFTIERKGSKRLTKTV